ncbi:MAG: hypothetical protein ACO1QS_17475, partial [Verrucomicrobiota bacterium]
VLSHLRFIGGTVNAGVYAHAGVMYEVRGSNELGGWSLMPSTTLTPAGLPPAPIGYEWASFSLPFPVEGSSQGFLRFRLMGGPEQ